jgi:uncharacterized protein YegJ (DUF2314 family)
MGLRAVLLALLAGLVRPASAQLLLENVVQDRVVSIEYNSEEMADAVRRARGTLSSFFELAANPRPGTGKFAVKIGLPTDRGKEFVWTILLRHDNGRVVARIDNTPRWTTKFRDGQTVAFTDAAIIDWLYIDGDRLKGNFTGCAINKLVSEPEAEAVRMRFRMTCEE